MNIIIVVLYLLVMLGIGIYAYMRGKTSKSDSFFVADRKGSVLLITGSLLATAVGASATVGLAGLGFSQGLTGAWWLLVGAVGLLLLSWFWAKKVRKFGVYTLPQLIEKQYGRSAGFVASVLIVVAWMGIIAAQIVAGGKILGVLFDSSPTVFIVICAAVFILYTMLGAQYSIIRTDFIQAGILITGVIAAAILVSSNVGWVDGFAAALPDQFFSFPASGDFGWGSLVSMLLLVGATYVVGPDIYSRLLCAKNEKVARSSAFWAALIIIPLAFALAIIGMGARVLFPDIAAEQALPSIVQHVLPVGLSGLVIAGLLAAIMSSADTCLLTTSTIMTEDVYRRVFPGVTEKNRLLVSRMSIAIIGLVALTIGLRMGGVIGSLLMAYTVFTSGIVIPVLLGFYRDRLRLNSLGAFTAVAGGGGTALVMKLLDYSHLELLGLGVCILLLFGVSWLSETIASRHSPEIQT